MTLWQSIISFFRWLAKILGMTSPTASVTGNITVADSVGNPLALDLTVTYVPLSNPGATPTNLGSGSVTTNSLGTGTIMGTIPAPGSYLFTAAFAGNSDYQAASFTTAAFVVTASISINMVMSIA